MLARIPSAGIQIDIELLQSDILSSEAADEEAGGTGEHTGQMSESSIALLSGLLSGGFLLLGVFVGYFLQKSSSAKTKVAEAVFHVFQQLMMLNGNEILLPQHHQIDPHVMQGEMDKASATVADIIDTVATTKGFPHTQEVVKAVTGIYEATDMEGWVTNYSSDYRFEVDQVIRLLEKKIDNQEFVKAFHNASEFWSVRTMEKNGASPEDIEEYKKQRRKARNHK